MVLWKPEWQECQHTIKNIWNPSFFCNYDHSYACKSMLFFELSVIWHFKKYMEKWASNLGLRPGSAASKSWDLKKISLLF
jgi:hypothetical protein